MKSKVDTIILFKDDIIPRLKKLLEEEKSHLVFLEKSKKHIRSAQIISFIEQSKISIVFLEGRLKEYKEYLKKLIDEFEPPIQ